MHVLSAMTESPPTPAAAKVLLLVVGAAFTVNGLCLTFRTDRTVAAWARSFVLTSGGKRSLSRGMARLLGIGHLLGGLGCLVGGVLQLFGTR
ncbi:hypothetical protein [Streptomyces sp. NPDC060184]|uniref:hypothetical protein n=1 Tax=Streptomyces sp. NPDC060184 TaxID=3347064 RepID=UPI00365843D7